jgi:adenosylmethionine-8-amino-7-oxononanoate aminotransferase
MGQLAYYHAFGGKTHPTVMALADKLHDMVPVKDAKVFFGNSGSDANDTLLKLVRYYSNATGNPKKTQDHYPGAGLPRRDRRIRRADQPAGQPHAL